MNDETKTFLDDVNENVISTLVKETDTNTEYFTSMVAQIAGEHSAKLDDLMNDIMIVLTRDDPPADSTLERYAEELASRIYFEYNELEALNVKADMSRASAKEIYNKAYLDACSNKDTGGRSRTTVNENQAIAETKAQYGNVVAQMYEHAAKIIRQKIEAAADLVSLIKTILKKRDDQEYLESRATNFQE